MKDILFKLKVTLKKDCTFYDEEKKLFIESKAHDVMGIWWSNGKVNNITIPYKESCITLFDEYIEFKELEVIE